MDQKSWQRKACAEQSQCRSNRIKSDPPVWVGSASLEQILFLLEQQSFITLQKKRPLDVFHVSDRWSPPWPLHGWISLDIPGYQRSPSGKSIWNFIQTSQDQKLDKNENPVLICATTYIGSKGGLREVGQSIVAKVREPSNQSPHPPSHPPPCPPPPPILQYMKESLPELKSQDLDL